jgi:RNA polymerase sigma-70 factor (ECF subfamily)
LEIADYIIADDRHLVELSLAGDDIAFEYLFNRYGDAMRRLFLQRSTSVEDTEDLLQETFIKVYVNLHRYSPEYTFGQWVYTIARNTHIDFERRRQEDISIDEKFSAPAAVAPSPEENLINLQQRTQIEHYINCLPEHYRRLFTMRFLEDYSYDEISEKLHLPMGTVKTQIHRARERMCNLILEGEKDKI